ncbi:MAG: SDR family oxidoreductase [Planctomycetes bacterium]|nr:SDR family oxidoreductase [Planctomycetota bacterium]
MSLPGKDLSGRTALVTGGARRLGAAVVRGLARAGAGVVIHYLRSRAEAESLAGEIRRAGGSAWSLGGDLLDSHAAADLLPRAIDLAGPIDVLVNSASIFPAERLRDVTPASIDENMRVHLTAPLLLARGLAAQGLEGHVVNFLDARIGEYDEEHAAYHLSKRALAALTRMLAVELAPRIAVNAVAPGLILPPAGKDAAYLEAMASGVPLRRHGGPEDIVDAVMFLLGSRFITGQTIYVDGGRHMKGRMYE